MEAPRCDWETGTVYTGERTCGRPAKFRTVETNDTIAANGKDYNVCGAHARVAERRWHYEVTRLDSSRDDVDEP